MQWKALDKSVSLLHIFDRHLHKLSSFQWWEVSRFVSYDPDKAHTDVISM